MTDNAIVTYDETEKVAKAMVASGFFKDTQQASQAIVKILAGRELGFGAFASMTGVNIIQGNPTIGANLMAAAIKATRKYNYRILEMTEKACEIEFYENGQPVGKSRFTLDDAKAAGLEGKDNWRKYPRNMLFARAISNGQRWYCPDACNGVTVYTPDEMGAVVDEDERVIDMPQQPPAKRIQASTETELPLDTPAPLVALETARAMTTSKGEVYGEMDNVTLAAIVTSIIKAQKADGITPQRYEELQYKLDCAKTVLEANNAK